MGFLDKVTSAAKSVTESVKGEIDKVRDSGKSDASVPVATAGEPAAADEDFLDATKPESWITPDEVSGIVGVAVTGPERCDTEDTDAVGFVGDETRVEVHSVKEAMIGALGSSQRGWVDARATELASHAEVTDLGDYAVSGLRADRAGACFVWCADTCFSAEVDGGTGDPAAAAVAVLRIVYDWPAP